MDKVLEDVYRVVSDPLTMPEQLNKVAEELAAEGYMIKRGLAGAVVITLDDGEINFVPADGAIKRVVFKA